MKEHLVFRMFGGSGEQWSDWAMSDRMLAQRKSPHHRGHYSRTKSRCAKDRKTGAFGNSKHERKN